MILYVRVEKLIMQINHDVRNYLNYGKKYGIIER